jgi:hypothetical protein|eukprot:COSAG06_NODE_2494_length_6760_cov_2.766136_3_plen_324_part_00
MPRRETDLQRENRLVRDGYDVRSYNAVHDQVKVRMEKLQKELALVERLRRSTEELAGSPGDPREFAALDSLIMQVGELKKKHVGPEPFRLVKRAKKILAAKRAVFFRSASSRPQTAPEPKAGGVAGSKSAPSLGADTPAARRAARQARLAQERSAVMRGGSAPRQKIRGRSFSNELGAPMLLSADAVPSFAKQIGAGNVNSNRERTFITDCQVFQNIGMEAFNVHKAAEKDPQLRKYFKQPAVAKVVQQNNPRRDSNLGWIDDRFYKKSTLREYNTLRNETWQGGHSKELVAGHSLDWPRQFGGIERQKSTIEEQGSGLGYWS